MADEKTTALTSAAREKVTGKSGINTIQLAFDEEMAPLYAKIEADAKADDRPVSKFLLRWVKQNYKVA